MGFQIFQKYVICFNFRGYGKCIRCGEQIDFSRSHTHIQGTECCIKTECDLNDIHCFGVCHECQCDGDVDDLFNCKYLVVDGKIFDIEVAGVSS